MIDVVDMCCGPRSFWFDAAAPHTIYGDQRAERLTVSDRSHGKHDGQRTIVISPNVLWDYRNMPFADNTFSLAVFDPPHFRRAGGRSFMAAKYGILTCNWKDDLRRGFSEAFRILKPRGVLNFKWNDTHIPLPEILPLVQHKPLFVQMRQKTHWLTFVKPER